MASDQRLPQDGIAPPPRVEVVVLAGQQFLRALLAGRQQSDLAVGDGHVEVGVDIEFTSGNHRLPVDVLVEPGVGRRR